jgi:hypothetical protein
MASNLTKLPARDNDAPRSIMRFSDGYLENVFFGGGWKRLAAMLADNGRVSKSMRPFVLEMGQREKRPSKKQLATMIGLMISAGAEVIFDEWERNGVTDRPGRGKVVPLNTAK